MKATSIFTAGLAGSLAVLALASPASAQDQVLQIQAKEIHLADGSSIENGVLVVRRGKIARIGKLELDESKPFLRHDGVLTAGFVACQSASGLGDEGHDDTRAVLAEARIAHAFSPKHSDFEEALEAGITSMVLAPSERNLAGGITATVKTAGGVVLAKEAHLALSFSAEAFSYVPPRFGFFFGAENEAAGRDGGPEDTTGSSRTPRPPTSYAGAVRTLNERLEDETGAFSKAKKGELPVLLTAWDRHEVARAARFAKANALRGAVRGAPLAGDPGLLPTLKDSGLAVVLGPFAPGQKAPALETVHTLQEAGVPVGFALDAPRSSPQNFRMTAALAMAAGAEAKNLLRSMTVVGAEIAGVSDRVGSLEPGKDADFVLWSGHPLDLSSRVEAVYVDGAQAWSRNR